MLVSRCLEQRVVSRSEDAVVRLAASRRRRRKSLDPSKILDELC